MSFVERVTAVLGDVGWTVPDPEPGDLAVEIHAIAPTIARPYYTLFTSGMSALPMPVPEDRRAPRRMELTLCLPPTWFGDDHEATLRDEGRAWAVTLLRDLARFPHDHDTWLAPYHTAANAPSPDGDARPYVRSTELCCALLAPPVLWPPELRELDGVTVCAVIPLYASEMTIKLDLGGHQMWRRLRRMGATELLDLDRKFGLPLPDEARDADADALDDRSRRAATAGIPPAESRTFAGFDDVATAPVARSTGGYSIVTANPLSGQWIGLPHARTLAARGASALLRELWTEKTGAALPGLTLPRPAEVLGSVLLGACLGTFFDDERPTVILLEAETMRSESCGEVTLAETLDDDDEPVPGGLMCPEIFGEGGARFLHTGHIELAAPVLHPWFLRPIADLLDIRTEHLLDAPLPALCDRLRTLELETHGSRLAELMLRAGVPPSALVLDVITVVPAAVRPIVRLADGRYATSDLNDLYRRVIEINATGDQLALQRAVIGLMCNGTLGHSIVAEPSMRILRSIADVAAGHLRTLHRRVDFSAAAPPHADASLSPQRCRLPAALARELDLADGDVAIVTAGTMRGGAQPMFACDVEVHAEPHLALAPSLLAALGPCAMVAVHAPRSPEAIREARELLRFGAGGPAPGFEPVVGWIGRAMHEELIGTLVRAVLFEREDPVEDLATRLLLGR